MTKTKKGFANSMKITIINLFFFWSNAEFSKAIIRNCTAVEWEEEIFNYLFQYIHSEEKKYNKNNKNKESSHK